MMAQDPSISDHPSHAGEEVSGSDPFETDSGLGARLHHLVADSGDIVEYLDFLTRTAVEVIGSYGGDVFCGITLLRPRRAATVSSSNDLAQRMDEAQYGFDDGPCLTAAREAREVYIEDVDDLPPSSGYRKAMEDFGVRSVLASPILLPGDSASALNLYSTAADAFPPRDRDVARRFAEEASKSMQIAVRIAELTDTGADLRAAMEGRHIIDTAVGVIMSQNHCSQEEAFAILRKASNSRNIKLRDLAQTIIDGMINHSPGNPNTPT
ncbi:GAF and ANTAR domain-containing protein [Arthrobacter sp. Soc17.1.1.1]|uniref:GAF and ANTAR domain-containing protein n=1 Tax=Arthrobacter sp. Soc17.1.1.1 TaxID=3121277 RepID=UPI002FE47A29